MRVPTLAAVVFLALAGTARAEIRADSVEYAHEGTELSGYLVYDDAADAKRPGLLMVPNWYGASESQVAKAKAIAARGYVVFVADVYGKSVRPANNEEAGKAATGMYQDRGTLRARAKAGIEALKAKAGTANLDVSRIGAIGFCFGGATVLELARDGAELAGVVSFHGNLGADPKWPAGTIKSRVLALNGADDTYVPQAQIDAFTQEMQGAGADWQFVNFGGAVHCFAEPDAASPGCTYHERSARRAFAMMDDFFAEAFGAAH